MPHGPKCTLFLLLAVIGCGSPAPGDDSQSTDVVVGQTAFQSVGIPSYGDDDEREAPDAERADVYSVATEVADRTILVQVTPYAGVQVIELTDPAAPVLLAVLEIDGWPHALYAIDDTVVVFARRWENGASTEVSTIDLSDPDVPTIVAHASLDGELRGSAQVGDQLALLTSSGVRSVGIAQDDSLVLGTLTPVGDYTQLLGSTSTDHFIVSRRVLTPSASMGENDLTPDEATELLVFDAIASQVGTTTIGGRLRTADVRQDVLRVVFETSHTGSFTPEEIVRTFDISDLANIGVIASATVRNRSEPPPILTPGRALFGGSAVSFTADGMLGQPEPTTMSWSHDNWRLVNDQTRLLVVDSTSVRLYDVGQSNVLSSDIIPGVSMSSTFGAPWVLEDAISVAAPDGVTMETGLLIFSHRQEGGFNQEHGLLQIFTFSDSTVTARGEITAHAHIFGAVPVADSVAVLTGGGITIQDLDDIAAPAERAWLDLVPTITNVFEYGDHLARRHADFNYASHIQPAEFTTDAIQIVPLDDPHGPPVASFAVPARSILRQVGNVLVATSAVQGTAWDDVETTIDVWDVSAPLMPSAAPGIVTTDLSRDFAFGLDQAAAGYHHGPDRAAYPIRDALIFVEREVTQVAVTDTTPFQSWATVQLRPLDVRDPAQPAFGPTVDIDDRVLAIVPDASRLYVTTWEDVPEGDGLKRHFLRTVDFADLDSPIVSDPIEVPGEVLQRHRDIIFTVDGTTGVEGVDARLNRLKIDDGVATLLASETLTGRDAHDTRFVHGSIIVSHAERWESSLTLDVVTPSSLALVSSTPIGSVSVASAVGPYVLYTGSKAVSILDPAQPVVRTLAADPWRRQALAPKDGEVLMIASGRYGLELLD